MFLQFLCSISLPVLPMSLPIHIFDFVLYVIGICIFTFFLNEETAVQIGNFFASLVQFQTFCLFVYNLSWECLDKAMLISEAPSILLACLAMPAAAHLFWRVYVLRRTPLLTESSSFISTPIMCTAPSLPLQRPLFGVTQQSDHLTCNLVDTCQTRENTQSVSVASQQSLECVETIAGLVFTFLGLVFSLILLLRMSWLYPFYKYKSNPIFNTSWKSINVVVDFIF